jgi:hypothetical protein
MPNALGDDREPLREEDIQGLKYFRKLWPLFERLHEVGCQCDFMDQYCALVLLFLFNPCVRSLRALQQATQLKNVQRKLRCDRASLGSLSEATDVFDPERLRAIIGELAAEVRPARRVGGKDLDQLLVAVDGSVVKTLSTIAQAAYLKNVHGHSKSAWRLHTHFDVDRGVPTRIDVTTGKNSGKSDETHMLRTQLEEDHCYVLDRWYAQFKLFDDIHAVGSSYVCRIRDNSRYDVLEDRPLSMEALPAGVLSDQIVALGAGSPDSKRRRHKVRFVQVRTTPLEAPRQAPRRQDRPAVGRRAADRHEPRRRAGGDHRRHLSASLDDRIVLSLLQAHPGLPALAEHGPRRDRNSDLLRHHRLPALGAVDRRQADAPDLRDGLPLPARLGRPGGAAGASSKPQAQRPLSSLLVSSAGSLIAAR